MENVTEEQRMNESVCILAEVGGRHIQALFRCWSGVASQIHDGTEEQLQIQERS